MHEVVDGPSCVELASASSHGLGDAVLGELDEFDEQPIAPKKQRHTKVRRGSI